MADLTVSGRRQGLQRHWRPGSNPMTNATMTRISTAGPNTRRSSCVKAPCRTSTRPTWPRRWRAWQERSAGSRQPPAHSGAASAEVGTTTRRAARWATPGNQHPQCRVRRSRRCLTTPPACAARSRGCSAAGTRGPTDAADETRLPWPPFRRPARGHRRRIYGEDSGRARGSEAPMAKLTISEAARACNVVRTKIQRAVKTGRLSLDAGHRVDTAELLRWAISSTPQPHVRRSR